MDGTVEIIDNLRVRMGDVLSRELKAGDRVCAVTEMFSLSAFSRLNEKLGAVKDIRVIFTAPTFTPAATLAERMDKARRQFIVSEQNRRESAIVADEYELKLRNRMLQKAVARECADWIREKAHFASPDNFELGLQTFLTAKHREGTPFGVMPFVGLTDAGLGYEQGRQLPTLAMSLAKDMTAALQERFDLVWSSGKVKDVTRELADYIGNVYRENEPELVYFLILYHLFADQLDDFDEDAMPNVRLGYDQSLIWKKLYPFQRDAAVAIINKLERYNGCILADSVGLGKTFTALAVMHYYALRNKNVLVLCPKKLESNWNIYNKPTYDTNPFKEDRMRFEVLCHTDLQRTRGESNGVDLARVNWGAYDLVVIDESHNFRNDKEQYADRETRYQALMRKVMREGVKTKVLMLSATPVNNRFDDLKNQLKLAYCGDPEAMSKAVGPGGRSVEAIFREADRAFRTWSDLDDANRTSDGIFRALPTDFITLLSTVTIARSRKHIQRFYDMSEVGAFPERRPVKSVFSALSTDPAAPTVKDIYALLDRLRLSVYTPLQFLLPSKIEEYENATSIHTATGGRLSQIGREFTLKKLMLVNILKRLESSVYSFRRTIETIAAKNRAMMDLVRRGGTIEGRTGVTDGFDDDIDFDEPVIQGGKYAVNVADLNAPAYLQALTDDLETLREILAAIAPITPDRDAKLQDLKAYLADKAAHPFNAGNRKVLVFSAFADTVQYLYKELTSYLSANGLNSAVVTGTDAPRSTLGVAALDYQGALVRFSPQSKEMAALLPGDTRTIDILFATDCISEGQNLQDCDTVVNFDIHWNPVRLVQRFGRIDRIGSKNATIQMVNFWPNLDMDEYLRLRKRVDSRMTIANLAASGDDNLLKDEDMKFRDEPLRRMQGGEIVEMESLKNGLSITDLGLNEYALALKQFLETHDLKRTPVGIHAVVRADDDAGLVPGVVFFLKNRDPKLRDKANYFHPFYSVYVAEDGTRIAGATEGKRILEVLRAACAGKDKPDATLCEAFNAETQDGLDMTRYSALLDKAIGSLAKEKSESDVDSLFTAGGTTALTGDVGHLDSFELIAFVVVRGVSPTESAENAERDDFLGACALHRIPSVASADSAGGYHDD